MWTGVRPCGGGSVAEEEVAGVFVAAALLVVTAELGEAAAVVVAAVVVAVIMVLVAMMAGVLEATSAIRAVDVEATSAEGVVVETGGDDVASTCAEASRISKMLANVRAQRTRRPIPATATMFVFIYSCLVNNLDNNLTGANSLSHEVM
jgi:hypothetical protein